MNDDVEELARFDGKVSIARALPYGIQHVLTMFVANLAPIMLLASAAGFTEMETSMLIQNAMLVAGIGTFIQLYGIWKVGAHMPIVMGISIAFVALLSSIAVNQGMGVVIGAVIVGGIVEGLLGLCAKYWRRFITPVVAGTVVASIGFSLLSVGAKSFGGGAGAADFGSWQNLTIGCVSLITCIAVQAFGKKNIKQLSVLFGLIAGYIVAAFMGKVDFSAFSGAAIISLPQIMPFAPEFDPSAIISVTLLYIVSATDTIGDTAAVAVVSFKRQATDKEMTGSIAADGFVSSLAGVFGCLPVDSFGQNVGLIAMTHVANRRAIATGASVLVIAGFVPIFAAVFTSVPDAVLGGCTIMMFGSILVSGFQMVSDAGFTKRNITIAATALAMGIGFNQVSTIFAGFPQMFQTLFGGNSVALTFIIALILSLVLPKEKADVEAKDAAELAYEEWGEMLESGESKSDFEKDADLADIRDFQSDDTESGGSDAEVDSGGPNSPGDEARPDESDRLP